MIVEKARDSRPSSEKPGWQKLLDDLDRIEKLFAKKNFAGIFNMDDWGKHRPASADEHKPEEKNYCGTVACLAGWLAIVSKHGFDATWQSRSRNFASTKLKWLSATPPNPLAIEIMHRDGVVNFESMAEAVYGMDYADADSLFMTGFNSSLHNKLKEARAIAGRMKKYG